MTPIDLVALLPLIVVSAAATAVMLVTAFHRNHGLAATLTLTGLVVAGGTIALALPYAPRNVTILLVVDRYALFYTALVIAAAFASAMFAHDYLEKRGGRREEFYMLLLLATAGSVVLVSSSHIVSFFLGLEILSVSLYAMIGYERDSTLGTEAAVKYLILGGASSAFLLFGAALLYADIGSMALADIAAGITGARAHSVLTVAGLGMILVSVGFKMALAPFHLWAADVYQGAPAPAGAFIASVSKGAIAALLLRYFLPVDEVHGALWTLLALAAIVSMFAGNLLALLQTSLKRILAYSSIANMGYLLVAFLAGGPVAAITVTYYLSAYIVTILAAFGVVAMLSGGDSDADDLGDYRGLASRRPWLAGTLTVSLLSLAGIPLTAGFLAKFWALYAGVSAGLTALVVILVVNSAIGLFYYLRVILTLYAPLPEDTGAAEPGPAPAGELAVAGAVALAALLAALFFLGIYPAPLTHLIEYAVADLF